MNNQIQEKQNNSDVNLTNVTENTLNTIHNIIITSENNCIGKQHNKIPNLILEVITPDKNMFIYMYI